MNEDWLEEKKVSEGKLLYDPLFAKKPDTELHDNPEKGLLGKAAFKKGLFLVCMILFVGTSLFLSFYSVSKDIYKYEENEQGWLLSEFCGSENETVLDIAYVTSDDGRQDTGKPVNEVRRFAVCCNEYLEFIYVSAEVETIDPTSFYYCKALQAVIVDSDNENYVSYDGVLYKKTDGVATEIILYPMRNGYYRAALALGLEAPLTPQDTDTFRTEAEKINDRIAQEYKTMGVNYTIRDTVKKVGQLSFSSCEEMETITIPDSVTEIETLAFFKCSALKSLHLPDGLQSIGSDAFGNCPLISYIYIPASVTQIGHHAFFGCSAEARVCMERADDSDMELGVSWLPQHGRFFPHNTDVSYGQAREEA